MIVKQSTARTIIVGPVLDSTGAAKTDEVVASIKITKNGTVAAADAGATLTHDHAGKYKLALTANDTNTLGVLEISLNSGTNDMPVKAMNVVPANVYDSLIAGSDALDISLIQWLGTAPLALSSQQVQSVVPTTQKVDVETIKTQAVTAAAAVTVGVYIGGTGAAALEATANSILTDTAEIGAAGAGLTAIPNMATVTNQTTIASYIDTEIGTIITHLTDIKGATWSAVTDTLEAIRDRGDAAWPTATGFALATVCTEARLAELDNANLPTDVANVKTDTAAILDDTGTSGVVVAAGSKTGYSLANGSIAAATFAAGAITSTVIAANAIGDSQLAGDVATGIFVNGGTIAESYAADGAVGTPAQLLYELLQNITEFVISGTTKTVKKRDGTTTAATYTLDDALTPTSITRAS